MIYQVEETAKFRRGVRRMAKRGADLAELEFVVNELRSDRKLDKKYKDHALTGNRQGTRECHIKSDWLLIYEIKNEVLMLLLIDTGTHDEVLGV